MNGNSVDGQFDKNRMTTHIQIQITFPDEQSAGDAARLLVENRLAACAQIPGPIRSVYVWKGICESNHEILLLAKTRTELFPQVVDAVRNIHPYECPQIVALPILAGNDDYLSWIDEQTSRLPGD